MITIGIDLGHCETTAAFCEKKNGKVVLNPIYVEKGERITQTQLCLTNAQIDMLRVMSDPDHTKLQKLGKIEYGKNVRKPEPGERARFLYFKRPPSEFDHPYNEDMPELTYGKLIACYVYALYEGICAQNMEVDFTRENVCLLVGCPTTKKWTGEQEQKAYEELILKATGVKQVFITPESRAALFSGIATNVNNNSKAVQTIPASQGVAVFDFGSSTSDFTYMQLSQVQMEFSWYLGASEIERAIVGKALTEEIERFREKNGEDFYPTDSSVADAENTVRGYKEAFYMGAYGSNPEEDFIIRIHDKDKRSLKLYITFSSDTMKEITEELDCVSFDWNDRVYTGSWRSLCREFFETARSNITSRGFPLSKIILTGGASGMGFILDECCSVFDGLLQPADILISSQPSYTVSNGLAWVSISDVQRDSYIEESVKALMEDPDCNPDKLGQDLSDQIFDTFSQVLIEETEKWANLPENTSIKQLVEMAEGNPKLKNIQHDIDKIIQAHNKATLSASRNQLNRCIRLLFDEQIADNLMIPEKLWNELQNGHMGTIAHFDHEKIINLINISSMVRKVVAVAIGAVITVAFIPAGLLIGPLITALLWPDDSVPNASEDELIKPRSATIRKKTFTSVKKTFTSENLSKREKEMKDKLKSSIDDEVEKTVSSFKNDYCLQLNRFFEEAYKIVFLDRFEEKLTLGE